MKVKFAVIWLVLFVWGLLSSPVGAQQQLKFNQIFSDTFDTREMHNIQWLQSGTHYTVLHTRVKGNEIRRYNINTGSYEVLMAGRKFKVGSGNRVLKIEDYEFSPDGSRILIKTNVDQIWRRSTKADYYVYNIKQKKLQKLTDKEDKIQYAQFAPRGLKVGFVYRNNLYLKDLESNKQIQITHDGEENKIINGAADWVYEEEFSFARAWFWSPDGRRIAFYRFDVREVPEFTINMYLGPEKQYPETMTYRYPKPGETNSTVKVGVYDLASDSISWMEVGSKSNQYIVRVDWTHSSDTLAIRRMNRLQNRQDLLFANPRTGQTWISRTKKSDTWIDENDDLTFLGNRHQYLFVSERSGYNHIYLSSMSGRVTKPVTTGNWEVVRIVGYDPDQQRVYYISTEASPLQRHLYSIRLDGTGKRRLTTEEGWHEISMSNKGSYYIDEYSSSGHPPEYRLYQTSGEKIRTLLHNNDVAELKKKIGFPKKEYMKIHLAQAGTLNAYMMKPPGFDRSKSYPALMYVYGGPGSQTVTRKYEEGQRARWHAYLAQQGYIVVSVDNRGTGGRGRHFEKQVYTHLGRYESADQIAAARYFGDLEYIDEERIGIWGWSYGGYMTSLVLGKAGSLFDAGISVAPVTHWKFYDTIYTERFMQTPQQNPKGYKESTSLRYADNIKAEFLLVHGTADDNVHFQNSIELVDRMVHHGIDFETLFYPNRDHGLVGGNTRRHLYRNMTEFLRENL